MLIKNYCTLAIYVQDFLSLQVYHMSYQRSFWTFSPQIEVHLDLIICSLHDVENKKPKIDSK